MEKNAMSNSPFPLKKLSDVPRSQTVSFWILAFIVMIIAGVLLIKFLAWFVPWFLPQVNKAYYH